MPFCCVILTLAKQTSSRHSRIPCAGVEGIRVSCALSSPRLTPCELASRSSHHLYPQPHHWKSLARARFAQMQRIKSLVRRYLPTTCILRGCCTHGVSELVSRMRSSGRSLLRRRAKLKG